MNPKIDHILSCAMAILKESGDQGLSMRKVAETADMRLSNVQYYFKTKELLLAALLEGFLIEYAQSMQLTNLPGEQGLQKQLHHLIFHILTDIEKSECAMVFKEIWAISERNPDIKKALDAYYVTLHNLLFNQINNITPQGTSTTSINRAIAILLPYIEGYCITSSQLKVPSKQIAEHLSSALHKLLE